jgi:hypothetical protein
VSRDGRGEVELVGWNIPSDRRKSVVPRVADEDSAFLQPFGFANGTAALVTSHRTEIAKPGSKLPAGPALVSGRLSKPGDVAAIAFAAKKGQRQSIRISSRELHFPLEPVLAIRDGSGKVFQKVQAAKLNTDPSLVFSPPSDGTYTIEVRDLFGDGSPRHAFLLHVTPEVPDFEVRAETDRFTGKPGEPIEIPVSIDRIGGFKGPLNFRAEGLPASTRVEVIEGKDAKKLTVRLQGLTEPCQTAFRLWAMPPGPNGKQRLVTLSPAPSNRSNGHFWLTITKSAK